MIRWALVAVFFWLLAPPYQQSRADDEALCQSAAKAYGASGAPADLDTLRECLSPTQIAVPGWNFGNPVPGPAQTYRRPDIGALKEFFKDKNVASGGKFLYVLPDGMVIVGKRLKGIDFKVDNAFALTAPISIDPPK
ncbi:MAG TPA: hypothetical protein VFB16_12115 [Bauldia sp.]|nr:hypothetical protein [Bauldia sp.]